MISIRTEDEIVRLRESARLLIKTFKEVEKNIRTGVKTETLNAIAEQVIIQGGGKPAFKGYQGYPSSICASINSVVVHGIPGKRRLKNGDIVSIDIGVELNGYFSDAAKTYAIGNISPQKKKLMRLTYDALYQGIAYCKKGYHVSDISHRIQTFVESQQASVVRAFVGHGIGKELHEEPQIPNYGKPRKGSRIHPGMVFAIEPMVNWGTHEVEILEDGWTAQTCDHQPSAHFEHTILVTSGEPEILTFGIEEGENKYG